VGWEYDPRTLVYFTAGLAMVNSSEYNIGDQDKNDQQHSDNSGWRVGWTAGAGVERALTDRLSAKAEYLYVDLSDNCGHGGNGGTYCYYNDANILRVGVNYKIH
jgi:outer membrane immunogenic protein